jgi:hypothetical protein
MSKTPTVGDLSGGQNADSNSRCIAAALLEVAKAIREQTEMLKYKRMS